MADTINYISFNNPEKVVGATEIRMPRGRMFEYTPTDLANGMEELGEQALAFLEDLPTLLCSEVSPVDDGVAMHVRFGRLSNAWADRREVVADFEPVIEFGTMTFESASEAARTFATDTLQLYRTHWAVRKTTIGPILRALAEREPSRAGEVENFLGADRDETEALPPRRKKNIIGRIDSVGGFLSVLQGVSRLSDSVIFYRGHEDENFELTPSLLRKWPDGGWQFLPREDRINKELLIAHYDEFQGDQYCFDRLVRMQHFGLPTRLLDISTNPLVALFFACHCEDELMALPGEVIIFHVPEERVKYYDSDTVSCISNISNLTDKQKDDIDLTLDIEPFNESEAAGKLLHHIRSEKGFFEARIDPDDLGSIVCVKAKQTNPRIKPQAGAFLLYGHEATLPESGQDGLAISRITVTGKRDILDQLDTFGINATTVYPSIEQTARQVKERYRLPSADSQA